MSENPDVWFPPPPEPAGDYLAADINGGDDHPLPPPDSSALIRRMRWDSHGASPLRLRSERRGQLALKAAHRSYVDWCEANAQPPLGRNTFADQLHARNLPAARDRGSNVTVITGLQLKEMDAECHR